MRVLFSMWSNDCCPGPGPNVNKQSANMTFRSLIARHNNATGMRSWYKFDYEFQHLLSSPNEGLPPNEGFPRATVPEKVDIVVVSMGLYEARRIPMNISQRELNETVRSVMKSICEVHKAPVGFFLAGGLECKLMKNHAVSSTRLEYRVCPQSSKVWRLINTAVRNMLLDQDPPEQSSCYIHYLPALKCRVAGKIQCTTDGIHPRLNFARTRLSLILNSLKVLRS